MRSYSHCYFLKSWDTYIIPVSQVKSCTVWFNVWCSLSSSLLSLIFLSLLKFRHRTLLLKPHEVHVELVNDSSRGRIIDLRLLTRYTCDFRGFVCIKCSIYVAILFHLEIYLTLWFIWWFRPLQKWWINRSPGKSNWVKKHTLCTVCKLELRKCKSTINAEPINTTGQKLTAW